MRVPDILDHSRWCWKHIPHNLIAGGGLNAYGGTYGHPDLGGQGGIPGHGVIVDPADSCQDCDKLRRMNATEYAAWQNRGNVAKVYCKRCKHWERICDCQPEKAQS